MRLAVRIPLLAAGAVLATGLVAATVAISVGRDATRLSAFAATEAGAEAYARSVEAYLLDARQELESTADSDDLRGSWGAVGSLASAAEATPHRVAVRHALSHAPAFDSMTLVHPDGSIHLVEPAGLQEALSRRDVGYLPWFAELRHGERAIISDVHISPATRRPTVVVAVPIQGAGGAVLGYLVGSLKVDALSGLGGSPTGDYFGYLTDRRGLLVAHGRDPRLAREQRDFSSVSAVQRALSGVGGAIEDHNAIEGEDRIAGYRPLPDLRWAAVYVVPSSVAYGPASTLARTVTLSSMILVVVVAIVATVFARRATRPIGRLVAAAAGLAGGDRTVSLPAGGSDEVGQLAAEFGRMVTALTEREDELRRRAVDLEASNRELEAFAYTIAHDLRTPLRAIDGFGGMLEARFDAPAAPQVGAAARHELAVMRESARQMGELIDDLLEFARLGRQALEIQQVDARAVAQAAFDGLAHERAGRDIDFRLGQLPDCRADPKLLDRVFSNLLSNAIKFTASRQQSHIEVGAREGRGGPAYFVCDDGVGLDMAYADEIFGVFKRLFRSEEYPGTGVGLAIVRRIVEQHGGRAWVEAAPGRGATFLFTLQEGTP